MMRGSIQSPTVIKVTFVRLLSKGYRLVCRGTRGRLLYHLLNVKTRVSRPMRKLAICICENKDADQLCGNREADQRLCFRHRDSTLPLLLKSKTFKLLACFCDCTAWFVSDLFGNHIVGFSKRGLKYWSNGKSVSIC